MRYNTDIFPDQREVSRVVESMMPDAHGGREGKQLTAIGLEISGLPSCSGAGWLQKTG